MNKFVLMETIIDAKILTGKKEFSAEFDKAKELLVVETTENPEKGKANKEIVKKLKKFFKADVEIVSGLKSKEKKIKIYLPREQVIQLLQAQTNSKAKQIKDLLA